MKLLFAAILILLPVTMPGQALNVSGTIRDAATMEPLPFVNVIYNNGRNGVVSNIDGYFSIRNLQGYQKLIFSLVGYQPDTLSLDTISGGILNISLSPKPVSLKEVVITPGINPALRIVNLVTENRNRNNPEKMSSFSYTSYNKMYFTTDAQKSDSLSGKPESLPDSVSLQKSYLMLMEFISERKFRFPDKNQEKIIASRVSGFKDPSFTLLATQLQSFSFYNDFFVIFDRYFINPISPGSTSRYSYILEDTFLTENYDTLFVISYKPQPGKNFDGLKGVLYVNSDGYAIQNVIAQADMGNDFSVRIQQLYELIDRKKWFPVQLNTQIFVNNLPGKKNLSLTGIGKSYLRDIRLGTDVSPGNFSDVIMSVAPEAYYQTDSLWKKYRPLPLTRRDSLTYQILDSIGRVKNFDQRLEIWETLSTGYIPIGYVQVDLRRFLNYNRKEGFRVGLGMQTNNRLSKYFTVGGHFAYGISDRKTKYGAFLQLFPAWESDTRFSLNYINDVTETGAYRFVDDQFLFSTELYRGFLVNRMDRIRGFESSLTFRALRYVKFRFSLLNATRSLNGYSYVSPEDIYLNDYHLTEAGFGLKLTLNEKFVQTPRGRKISTGTRFPVLWFNYKQGMNLWDGDFVYRKYEGRLSKTFSTKTFGKTSFTLVSALADRTLPLGLLYNGHGNYSGFSLESENSFGTMRMNEFYSSEFVSGFFRQNFESLLFRKGSFKPEIAVVFNAGVGKMKNPDYHQGIEFRTMEKGYYETGLVLNKLINQKLFGYGLVVYYRLGPYAFAKTADNFSFKLALTFNFQ